jgi:hypothetical protein
MHITQLKTYFNLALIAQKAVLEHPEFKSTTGEQHEILLPYCTKVLSRTDTCKQLLYILIFIYVTDRNNSYKNSQNYDNIWKHFKTC